MQKFIRILFAAALIALVIWLCWTLFPSPERIIRSRLKNLAKIVSFEPGEGGISKAFKAQKLTDYFTVDAEAYVDVRGFPAQTVTGRDELMRGLMVAQSRLNGLKVEFMDINVKLADDKQSAVANLTAQANFTGDHDFNLLELNFTFKKIENRWVITRVETVKTLSLNLRPPAPALRHES
ncbi:MAG TPA: hypothetical protein VK327_02525 [Candidatus Paceibacterota bacterium]|nr:hypothetical protein [Candidatus Paceibacterota bacterium]